MSPPAAGSPRHTHHSTLIPASPGGEEPASLCHRTSDASSSGPLCCRPASSDHWRWGTQGSDLVAPRLSPRPVGTGSSAEPRGGGQQEEPHDQRVPEHTVGSEGHDEATGVGAVPRGRWRPGPRDRLTRRGPDPGGGPRAQPAGLGVGSRLSRRDQRRHSWTHTSDVRPGAAPRPLGSDPKPALPEQMPPRTRHSGWTRRPPQGSSSSSEVEGRLSIYFPIRLKRNNYRRCY